jgi:hypothetical protein
VLKGRTDGPTTVPAYWDVDARVYRRVGENDLRLGFLRSGDFLSARLGDTFSFAPAESAGLEWDRQLTLASLNWERKRDRGRSTRRSPIPGATRRSSSSAACRRTRRRRCGTFDWRGRRAQDVEAR